MSVYRDPPAAPLVCPRCKKTTLPPLDVAPCACGTWVSAFAADVVLTEAERRPDLGTRWWRVREPCPVCGAKMTLRGHAPGLFQGCDGHGFWIDADAVAATGLGRGVDEAALARKHDDEAAVAAAQAQREAAEHARDEERLDRERREAALTLTPIADPTITPALLQAAVISACGVFAGRYLLGRLDALEARNAALEARLAALETFSPTE